jgi:hypothetical protein
MNEAQRAEAELRRQNKQLLDTIAQFQRPTAPQPPAKETQPQLTPEQKLEMLQNDPVGYLDKLQQEAEERAEKRVFGKLSEQHKVNTQQQQVNNFVAALDKQFRVTYADLSDPLYEPYIKEASQQVALTQDGAVLLVTNPPEFLRVVADAVRPKIESLKTRFNPTAPVTPTQAASAQTNDPNITRERISASPVVKPSSASVIPAGPTEEKGETPQEYSSSRRLNQKRIFGQVTA